ncbi:hypothetical protein HGP16_25565 [Rhizobium sp. P40RR-XXII]|uniref:hypothetical protein n=1 Tax=Rhizobium sp. P40RR-XXII TaxID=2726739 RepID=UPI0014574144|nr:hypothetical protein [Rhizobium sp. P40RR-XXII]NLS19911.1 hypothetical protein [Rhizobium sp. P40RR-XXII]
MTSIQIDRTDGLSSSVAVKGPCRVATTANIALYGEQTIDGVAVVTGDRVLVKNQTAGYENGIYVADTGQWRRSRDFNKTKDVVNGTQVLVLNADVDEFVVYCVSSSDPVVIGTSVIQFQPIHLTDSAAAEAAKAAAQAAQALAEAAAAEAEAAAATILPGTIPVANRAAMAALDTSVWTSAALKESGREGVWRWVLGDFTTLTGIDTSQGVYCASSTVPVATGCWVRNTDGEVWANWFGLAPGNAGAVNNTAFLAACNFAKQTWGKLHVRDGSFTFSGTLNVAVNGNGYALHIEGQGNGKTRFLFPLGDGLYITRSNGNWWYFGDATKPTNTATVAGIDFIATGGTNGAANGAALTFYGNDVVGRPTATFRVHDCMFASDSPNYCWAVGIQTLSASNVEINYCQWYGALSSPTIGKFIWFRAIASGQDASPYHVTNCYAYYFQIAVQGESFIEGIHISDCDFVSGSYGVFYECNSSDESQLVMHGCHVNTTNNAIYLKRVDDSQITGNLLWTSGAGNAVVNCIDAHSQTIIGNEITATDSNVGVGTGISITAVTYNAATNILRASVIDANVIQYCATGIVLAAQIRNYKVGSANRFAGCAIDVQDQANLNFVGDSVFKNTTAAATAANTTATNLMSVTLPSEYLHVGKRIKVKAYGRTAANTNGKTVLLTGATISMGGFTTTTSGASWELEATIDIISSTSQKATLKGIVGATAVTSAVTLPSNNLASGLAVAVQATNSVAAANDIICESMSVEIVDR